MPKENKKVSVSGVEKPSPKKNRDFDDYINEVEISHEKEMEIAKDFVLKEATGSLLELSTLGRFVIKLVRWKENFGEKIREKKIEFILAQHFSKSADHTEAIKQLKDFLSNPYGCLIFYKILKILDNGPFDPIFLGYLSNTLRRIVKSKDFENLFERHKYVLSRIEILSVQALTILSDYENWPDFNLSRVMTIGSKVSSDWESSFVKEYVALKKISDPEKFMRIKSCLQELVRNNLADACLVDKQNRMRVSPTANGNDIVEYINID